MGGRGSCYLNFYDNSKSTSGDIDLFDILEGAEEDKDTEKEYNGKTEKLKQKNIDIKESTDKIPEEIFLPNVYKIDSLTRKYTDTTKILGKNEKELAIRSDKLGKNTVACFVHNGTKFDNLQIILNKDLILSSKKRIEEEAENQIKIGFWVKCDKGEYINQTITHEFGHYVQKVLMQKELGTKQGKIKHDKFIEDLSNASNIKDKEAIVQKYSEDYATKYFKSIQRIHRKHFGKETINDISRYGEYNNREAFAELFANLNCSKEPTTLGKATEIFLAKKMLVKNPMLKQFDKTIKE